MTVGVQVEIEGAEEVIKAFNALGYKSRDLAPAWQRIGGAVKRDAVSFVPTLSGRLAATIRQSNAKTRATVSAGGYGVLYAGVQNYGWPGHNIAPKYFLNDAIDRNQDPAARELLTEMDRLITRVGLDH